jgi:hypothetical protein
MRLEISEKEVEDIIFEKQLLEQHDIKCVFRQKNLGVAGIADLIGWDRENKTWVIIEIKKGVIDAKAYAQAMRYQQALCRYLDERCRPFNPPYILMIGGSLADELRFLTDIVDDQTRSSLKSYYTCFMVEPKLRLNYHLAAQVDYADKLYEEVCESVSWQEHLAGVRQKVEALRNDPQLIERRIQDDPTRESFIRAFFAEAIEEIENGKEANNE